MINQTCIYLSLLLILSIFCDGQKLVLIQTVWRHGDRSPTFTYPNDPNKESAWPQGWGQLTVRGMIQQVMLGNLIRDQYVNKSENPRQFLNSKYISNEIYVRSTDLNRTIMSALSNMNGMYYKSPTEIAGKDYPEEASWPYGYVPVAIHNVPYETDYVCHPLFICPRRDWLWKEALNTTTLLDFKQKNQGLLDNLTKTCGEVITLDNVWFVKDVTFIEKQHDMKTIVDGDLYQATKNLSNIIDDYQEGLDLGTQNGIDFLIETAKIRGGSLLWALLFRFNFKILCIKEPKNPSCKWINGLNYFAYSAHDNTMSALLTALGAKKAVVPNGYPGYAAAIMIELWEDKNGYFLNFRYHKFLSEKFETITDEVNGCKNYPTNCPFDTVYANSVQFFPGNITKLCQDVASKSTNFWPSVGYKTIESILEREELQIIPPSHNY